MSEIPAPPDGYDDDPDLGSYIDDLHDRIESLEEELDEVRAERESLQTALSEIEAHVTSHTEDLQDVRRVLERTINTVEQTELPDGPSKESADALDKATGYDGRPD